MSSVDIDRIRDDADRPIIQEPYKHESEFGDVCHKGLGHSQQCQTLMNALKRKCIRDQIDDARQCRKKLASLRLLRDCARNPRNVNEIRILMNMTQDSCMYNTEYVRHSACIKLLIRSKRAEDDCRLRAR